MAGEPLASDSVDPLSGLSGPSLFPRTIRASADGPVPADLNDLNSLHNFMKSLKLRSPKKLMKDAKRILDRGANPLESNFSSSCENGGVFYVDAAKGKERNLERRQGLNRARQRAPFTVKASSKIQTAVSSKPAVDIDSIEDPDEFFDEYERIEKAEKEKQRQLGGSTDNLNLHKTSTDVRPRRKGILGKSYSYKHRYSSPSSESDGVPIYSQETVNHETPVAPNDDSKENFFNLDPILDDHAEEVEMAELLEKSENDEVSHILEELLSHNDEDLEGDGAFNLLQDRLKIKPLDIKKMHMPDLHSFGRASISNAGESSKKPYQSSSVMDCVFKNANESIQIEHVQWGKFVNPASSPTYPRSPLSSLNLLKKKILQPNPLKDPFSPLVNLSPSRNASPVQSVGKINDQVDAPNDLGISALGLEFDTTVSAISNIDSQKVIGNTEGLPEQHGDDNESVPNTTDSRPNEESDENIEASMNLNKHQSKPSILEDEIMDDPSSRQQNDPEQQPKIHQAKLETRKRRAGGKLIGKAHPIRKSLAESGTSFENGVRRSKRIKMRPLEYWKGERFLFGRLDDSVKLLGVKYISPAKGDNNLKVKPYISSESSEYKELLELASRH